VIDYGHSLGFGRVRLDRTDRKRELVELTTLASATAETMIANPRRFST
jgi:hypothetical protein